MGLLITQLPGARLQNPEQCRVTLPSQFDLPSRSQQRATGWWRWILKIGPTLEMNSNSNRWAGLGAATPLWLLAGQCLQSPASVGGADQFPGSSKWSPIKCLLCLMCTVQRDPVVRVGWGNDNVIWYFQLLVSISLVLKCSFQLLTGPGTTQLLSTGSRVIKIYPTEKMTKIHFYVDIWWGLVGDLVRCWSPAPTLVTFFYEQLHIWVVNWSTLAVTDTLFILPRPHRATPASTGPPCLVIQCHIVVLWRWVGAGAWFGDKVR